MQMRGKPRCRFVTGTNWPVVDDPVERPLRIKCKRKAKGAVKPPVGKWKRPPAPKPATSETRPAVLVTCPRCGCSVADTRLPKHLLRCPMAEAVLAAPPKPLAWVMLTPADIEAAEDRSPAGLAIRALKQDNLLRSWILRQRKDLLRRLARLDIEDGVKAEELCGMFEGRHILMDQLVRQYLRLNGQPEAGLLDRLTLAGFIAYVRSCTGDRGLEQFPLRIGFSLLSSEARAALEVQRSSS